MTKPAGSFWTDLPLARGVDFLTADANGLAAFSKPAGVLSHPNEARDQSRSLLTVYYDAAEECYRWSGNGAPEPQRVWLLNRLDSATSGVILVTNQAELAREIRAQFKRKQVTKIYQALVFGRPAKSPDVWRDLIAVSRKGGQIRSAATAGNIPSESRMTTITARGVGEGALALIQLEPRTGRSHQLRVQCAKRHLPIVGDQTYGDFGRNRAFAKRAGTKRMFLHSLATRFEYEWKGKSHAFSAKAELPPEFGAALGG